MYKILLIYRAARFCPAGVEKDEAILDAVARKLSDIRESGHPGIRKPENPETRDIEISTVHEDRFPQDFEALKDKHFDIIIHQCRSKEVLQWLTEYAENHDTRILNTPQAVLNNSRRNAQKALEKAGLPTPESIIAKHPDLAGHGYWIKSDDTGDSSESHVRFVSPESANRKPKIENRKLKTENRKSIIIQPHIPGECVKFYGVGKSIFDLDIFGGDAIITPYGEVCIIDINDFPSFSACREEAAKAITENILSHEKYFFYPDSLPLCSRIFCKDNSAENSASAICGASAEEN